MNIFIFICLSFMFGCFCGIKIPAVSIASFTVLFGFAFLIKALIFKLKKRENLYILLLFTIFFSSALFGFSYDRFKNSEIEYGAYKTVTGIAKNVTDISFTLQDKNKAFTIYRFSSDEHIKNNDIVTASGTLMNYPVSKFPGGIDQSLFYKARGIYGYMQADNISITGHNKNISVNTMRNAVQSYINRQIDSHLKGDIAGFIKALLTGDTSYMSDNAIQNFSVTGVSHLISVSGLHLSIFLSLFACITSGFRRNRFWHFIITVLLIALYMLIIGERASIIRAGIMLALGFLVTLSRQRSDSVTNLTITGVLVCIINPYYITDAGFQLSFLVTFGIVLFAKYFKHQFLAVPAIAMLFVLPVSVYYFNTLSVESVLVNILVVCMVPLIILFGYIGCIVSAFLKCAEVLAFFVLFVTEYFAKIDLLHITLPSPDVYGFVFWFLTICIFYFFFEKCKIDNIVVTVICMVALLAYTYAGNTSNRDLSVVNFINNNNYNMEHIVTNRGKNILVDCGYDASSYAKKQGIDDFYMVFISSNIKTKYAGLQQLCKSHKVSVVLLPESMKSKDLHLENSRILYYNQDEYSHTVDNVRLKLKTEDEIRFCVVSVYNKTILIPVNTDEIASLPRCDIMSVPHECTDCSKYVSKQGAEIYIHPSVCYDYYDYGHKYITSLEGMVQVKVHPLKSPTINIY